jgi:sigma-B regulation protein RsbU (phosphoserine phosphatase)
VQKVKSGDIIITYTDGIVEALNEDGQQFTADALLDLVKKNHAKPSKELANLVKAEVKKFSGNADQHDDESLLIIKIQ